MSESIKPKKNCGEFPPNTAFNNQGLQGLITGGEGERLNWHLMMSKMNCVWSF